MHNNYYLLRLLSSELESTLTGTVVSECFSQSKDELIIRFETTSSPFFIKASLLADFCCLSFPHEFNRARKNSVDLFSELIGLRVTGIRQFINERSFSLLFNHETELLFKMHGNRANLVLFTSGKPVSLFRNHLIADLEINLHTLDKSIDWSEEAFRKNIDQLNKFYFTFGKVVWKYLHNEGFEEKSAPEKWSMLHDVIQKLEHPEFYITKLNDELLLSLVEIGEPQQTFTSAKDALHQFSNIRAKRSGLQYEKDALLTKLRTRIKNGEAYLKKTSSKLKEIEADNHYKFWADLIMANLYRIEPGVKKIALEDFSTGKPVEIKLREELNAQKNAAIYYRKAKNQHIEIEKLKEAIDRKEDEILKLNNWIADIERIDSANDLKLFIRTSGLQADTPKKEAPLPYYEFEMQGYKIWVGKNAKHNDELTQRLAHKEDLWLHAKDVSGSHVLIKYQAGKNFPKPVIERAAELAAYYSKRKTETLCPVIFTPKKFVRKRKGDPPGAVIVEKEEVIMVEPKP
ncbi:MAG: DUF814 domain-containing protein [Cyclobacteriaceae bacterium]|nr:DUF814 domain-containing protein [Cyclobacteriaceae bacterium]